MIPKLSLLIALLVISSISYAHGDERSCEPWDDPSCGPGPAFSVDNVHLIHDTIYGDGARILEASWHETEPTLVVILGNLAGPKRLRIWRLEFIKHLGVMGLVGTEEALKQDPSISDHSDPGYTALAVTNDKIVVGTRGGSLLFWDIEREEFLYEIAVSDGPISEILVHPSHEWILVVDNFAKLIQVDLSSRSAAEIAMSGNGVQDFNALALSNDGRLLAAAGNGAIGIWDIQTLEAWEPSPLHADSAEGLIFVEGDSQLLVLSYASVSRWSLIDNSLRYVQKLESYGHRRNCFINDGDVSPDETLLMTIDDCGQTRAWNLTTDAEMYLPQLDYSEDYVRGEVMQFSPDGTVLFTGNSTFGNGKFIIHDV